MSRVKDGIAIAEVDLNLCRQVKDNWGFQMTGRHSEYAKLMTDYVKDDYKRQIIKDDHLQ